MSDSSDQDILKNHFESTPSNPSEKIEQVKNIFLKSGAVEEIQQMMKMYTEKALAEVEQFLINEDKKKVFKTFALELMERKL
jgi:geranylgeranyl diphosphate synthase type II